MKTTPGSSFRRTLARFFFRLIPAVRTALDVRRVVESMERSDTTLRVLLALERSELGEACRAAVATEDAAAHQEGRGPDHGAALAAAERRVGANWALVWGDPPSGHKPRKRGAWAALRSAQLLHDLQRAEGWDGTLAAARLTAAQDALVRALPAAARKAVAEVLA